MRSTVKKPCWERTRPEPRQLGHKPGGEPLALPVASHTSQRTVLGTLGDIVARARGAGLEPPVLIVIGDVVRLRERLDWFESRGGGLDAGREGAGRCPAIVSR